MADADLEAAITAALRRYRPRTPLNQHRAVAEEKVVTTT
jgi:hypothetical protein